MGKGLMGVDLGSGGCKVVIIDPDGRIRGQAYQEWPTYYPHPGWSEQDPKDWEETLAVTVRAAISKGEMTADEVVVLAITSATHSMVFLDKRDQVLRPAILWTDKRTTEQVRWLSAQYGDLIFKETLHAPNVVWSLPYLIWVREKEPWIWEKTRRILMPKDYIRLRLTGVWATDPIDAVGTLMFNPSQRIWSRKVCNAVGISPKILPSVLPPEKIVGGLTGAAADRLGLREGTPVIVGTTDQATEALGAGAISAGQGIIKIATAGNLAVVTKTAHPDPLRVFAYLHIVPNQWYTITGVPSCAVCYRWLRDTFFEDLRTIGEREGVSVYERMDSMAKQIPVGSEGLIFHPHLHGSFTDPCMKGDFIGITFRHTRAHFVRSLLEGVAFALYDGLRRVEALGVAAENFRLIGGGAKSPLWRQIVCDVFGREMVVPTMHDSSFGAAMLGGIATSIFNGVKDAVEKCVRYKEKMAPDKENHRRYQKLFKCYKDMEGSLKPNYMALERISLSNATS